MTNHPVSSTRPRLNETQRQEVVRLYESGVANAAQLARRYGVHRDVVYRHLKTVGAVKGRLAHEAVRDLEAEIGTRQRREQELRWADENRRLDAFIEHTKAVGQFMEALLQADRDGRLAEFGRGLRAM